MSSFTHVMGDCVLLQAHRLHLVMSHFIGTCQKGHKVQEKLYYNES